MNWEETEPWWLSWLEGQSHDVLSMLKVEGSNTAISRSFLSGEIVVLECACAIASRMRTKPQFSE